MATLSLQSLLDAIEKSKTRIEVGQHFKVDPLQIGLSNIQTSLDTLGAQVELLEERVSTNENSIDDFTERVKALEKSNTYLLEKVYDMENRLRRSNIRVVGIPEMAEGPDMIRFMSKLIPSLLGPVNFPSPPIIEAAHRSRTQRPNSRDTPRVIIVKMLNRDKTKIVRLAKDKKNLKFNDSSVFFISDLSASLEKRHKSFKDIKKELRDRKIKYFVKYPCTALFYAINEDTQFVCPQLAKVALISAPNSLESMG